jgi:hypothetical protein
VLYLTDCFDLQTLFQGLVEFADAAWAVEQAAAAAQQCLYNTAALATCTVAPTQQDWNDDALDGLATCMLAR